MCVLSTRKSGLSAFTLIEIMVVVIIIAIAMTAAVPMFSSGAAVQVQSAASMLASDIEYARSMAIARQKYYGVTFNPSTESYRVVDCNGTVLKHPVRIGTDYQVAFASQAGLGQVDIISASFDTTSTIKFNYIGAPYNGDGNPLNSGTVVLSGGGVTINVVVKPITGYIEVK